jgi:hypothetical protein
MVSKDEKDVALPFQTAASRGKEKEKVTEAGRVPTTRVSPVGVCRSLPASGGRTRRKLTG